MNKSEQLIACLEGEIAKRDARIVELEEKSSAADDAGFNLRGLLKRGAFALGLDPENTSWFEVICGLEQLAAYMAGADEVARLNAAPVQQVGVPDGLKLVPVEPTPEMVSAAEEAHMPFGDMDIALRMAILSAPSAPATEQGVNQQMLTEYPDEMANGEKMANCNTDCRSAEGVTVGLIDGLITIARVLTLRDLSPAAVQEALIDLRSDEDLARVLGHAIGKGVNAQLLEALEALEDAARQVMAGEMAPSSIMVERMKSRAAIAAAIAEGGK